MNRYFLIFIALFFVFGCGVQDPKTLGSGIVVSIPLVSYGDGPDEAATTLNADAIRNKSCPGTGDPEVLTNSIINITFQAVYVLPEKVIVLQKYNWVHLQSYTVTYTPKNPDTTAEIPPITRNIQMDIEIGGQPELSFILLSLEQKNAWAIAQADFGDFEPREYSILVDFQAVDPRQNPVTILTEQVISIGEYDNC